MSFAVVESVQRLHVAAVNGAKVAGASERPAAAAGGDGRAEEEEDGEEEEGEMHGTGDR